MKEIKEPHLKKVMLEPVQLSIEPQTRLLLVQQGDNTIRMTRDQVNNLKRLRENEFEDNVFTSTIKPTNRFQKNDAGSIIASCVNDYGDDTVVIQNTKRYDDLARITAFVDQNKARIAWSRDFRRR